MFWTSMKPSVFTLKSHGRLSFMYPLEFPLNFNKFTLDTHDLNQYLVTKFSVSARNIKQKRVLILEVGQMSNCY